MIVCWICSRCRPVLRIAVVSICLGAAAGRPLAAAVAVVAEAAAVAADHMPKRRSVQQPFLFDAQSSPSRLENVSMLRHGIAMAESTYFRAASTFDATARNTRLTPCMRNATGRLEPIPAAEKVRVAQGRRV
jgi:hypothetical protein